MASWLSADGVVSLLFDNEFGLSEAESDERDLQESNTDVFALIGSPTVVEAVHSSDDSTCNGSESSDAEGES